MSDKVSFPVWQVWLVAIGSGLFSGLVTGAVVLWASNTARAPVVSGSQSPLSSQTPALSELDAMRCPRGLISRVQVRGAEDGFSRLGEEPSQIEPSLTRFGSFRDAQDGKPRALGVRAYDEAGLDKQLIDYFDIPQTAVSGTLIIKLKSAGSGYENDFLKIIPTQTIQTSTGVEKLASFSISTAESVATYSKIADQNVVAIPLEAFVANGQKQVAGAVAPVLVATNPAQQKSGRFALIVSDDTMVDVAALSLCLEPDIAQGVTFAEASDKPLGPDYSVLSCAGDETQSYCGPYSGDTACTTRLPIACYRDGANPKPANLTDKWVNPAAFVGGTVRPSRPVAAGDFPTRQDADRFCASQFGAGFRVLSYQEGGGGVVVSQSQVPAKTRLWVDIGDQPRGRCWDRPTPLRAQVKSTPSQIVGAPR
jgi:hypothetical protein